MGQLIFYPYLERPNLVKEMAMTSQSPSRKIWRLRKGADRRFRSGHPWVYSNELMESPKGIEPGEIVELRDAGGAFLARGFGSSHSLIAFRALTRTPDVFDPGSKEEIFLVLVRALRIRQSSGLTKGSFRLCYGEADGLPGLVIDLFRMNPSPGSKGGQTFVIQAHSAGANRILPQVIEALEALCSELWRGDPIGSHGNDPIESRLDDIVKEWDETSVVLRNDLRVRKLEGIAEEPPRVIKASPGHVLQPAQILVQSVLGRELISFDVDLMEGQKTGFFLDQFANIQLTALRFKELVHSPGFDKSRPFKILDLCCYVGQWGAQLTKVFREAGVLVEVVAVDASSQALEFAKKNIERQGARVMLHRGDILKDLGSLEPKSFDLVISDPPAFIKNRKDLIAGTRAYAQLTQQALRLVRDGGGIVCCSCSGLLEEERFVEILAKASQKAGGQQNRPRVKWIGKGTQSPDHPMLPEFPEGRYLKCWIGLAESTG
jgi:23S rRNA (cytosine1962-C5)-methyltransferase